MENQLQVIVKESGLDATKAQFILEKFQDYFAIASEWEKKAKVLIVTDASQVAEMQMARTGRLFLREKRIAVENARKNLKEQALREGKAIDGIANVLKALIIPIEEHLERQEKFIELKKAAEVEARRVEGERLLAVQEAAKQKAEAEERERICLENERLKAKAVEREKQIFIERAKQEKLLAEERAKAEAERKAMREAAERAAAIEREKQEKILVEQKAKTEEEHKKVTEEKTKLKSFLANQIECPFCHKRFSVEKNSVSKK